MKRPDNFLTNPETTTGRDYGAAKNNPGDNTGSGMDKEIYNDPAYAALAVINSYKQAGVSNTNETLEDSDLRDALEELTEKKVTTVPEWDNTAIYSAVTLVTWKGYQFVAYNLVGNTAKDPLMSPDYWYKIPKSDTLLDQFYAGLPVAAGTSPLADRAGANYHQNISYGKYRLGDKDEALKEFARVHLDGEQLTGDATLEAIFDPGGPNEYFLIDIFAPDVLGTRTLLDLGEHIDTPQSSGGENDILGEILADRIQGHLASANFRINPGSFGTGQPVAFETGSPSYTWDDYVYSLGLTDDGINGTPRTGSTTRPKEFTTGISYIVVMTPS